MSDRFLVMGANGGIGQDLAIRLSQGGASVVATVRDPSISPPELRQNGIDIRRADVSDSHSLSEALSDLSDGSALSGFAYCIGLIDLIAFKSATTEHFLHSYEINVLGAINALKIAEKSLKAGKGSVVLFSSIAAQQGFPNHTVISSAKGAIEGLTKSLAAEWAGQIRVNCIAPSLTDTALASPLTSSPPMRDAIAKMHPIPRLGTPQDSAALAEFLLSPEAGWITGQIFHVDGGRSTLRPKG